LRLTVHEYNMRFTTLAPILALLALAPTIASAVDGQPVATDGDCTIDVRMQTEGEVVEGVPSWHPDGNIMVKLAGSDCDVGVSPTWTITGWDYTVVQIAPNAVFKPPALGDNERQLVKILRGTLLDVNVNGIFTDGHWETHAVTAPNRALSMYLDSNVDEITAGNDGAVMYYMKVTEEILSTHITDMTSFPITDKAGPFSENIKWEPYVDVCPEPVFIGVEFYNMAGIFLQDNDGSRLSNMQFWTIREDMLIDGGYHQYHDFGEIHMTNYAANGVSGMQTTLKGTENKNFTPNPPDAMDAGKWHQYKQNDQPEVQIAIPMPPGYAHGPLWSVDPATGEPTYRCDGTIQYPKHRMLLATNGKLNDPLRFTSWTAFETVAKDVKVPLKMMTEWPNANLQQTMTPEECAAADDSGSAAAADDSGSAAAADDSGSAAAADDSGSAATPESPPVVDAVDESGSAYHSDPATLVMVALSSIFVAIA